MKLNKILNIVFSVLVLFSFEMNAQNEFTNAIIDTIPFSIVEEKPTFRECQDLIGKERWDCFKDCLNEHTAKNKRYPIDDGRNIAGRVIIIFVIDTEGKVKVLKTRGPDKWFEQQAREIIEKLPPLIPGKHKGKPVVVNYVYSIFYVDFLSEGKKANF